MSARTDRGRRGDRHARRLHVRARLAQPDLRQHRDRGDHPGSSEGCRGGQGGRGDRHHSARTADGARALDRDLPGGQSHHRRLAREQRDSAKSIPRSARCGAPLLEERSTLPDPETMRRRFDSSAGSSPNPPATATTVELSNELGEDMPPPPHPAIAARNTTNPSAPMEPAACVPGSQREGWTCDPRRAARPRCDSRGGLRRSAVVRPSLGATDELINPVRERRAELVDQWFAWRFAAPPHPDPLGTSRCADCGTPCGTAARCAPCAAARVPPPSELQRCPTCARVTHHAAGPCLSCMAVEAGEVRLDGPDGA